VKFWGKAQEKNNGDMFESYVQFVYQTLVSAHGKSVSVSRRAMVQDTRGNSYNIDVYYEFDVAGVPHRVAIECKDTARPVSRDDAIAFAGKVRDLPSTIGIFISNGGFQPAAEKYLEDHGILHYGGGDLPHMGQLVAAMISPVLLPSESAVGQPFWTLMEVQDGGASGVWCCMPDPEKDPTGRKTQHGKAVPVFPLLYSRPHAERFRLAMYGDADDVAVRGVEQSMLRFLILESDYEGRRFSVMQPYRDEGRDKFACTLYTAREFAEEYSTYDLSGQFHVE
jgi:hypothetical protein